MGVQWTAFGVEEVAEAAETGLRLGVIIQVAAGGCVGRVGKQRVHAVRAHIDVALIGVVGIAAVPVDAVDAQRQRNGQDGRQHEERPGNPAVQGNHICRFFVDHEESRAHRGY